MTSRPSRAIVHRACNVYIALPSDSRATTRRSGHATAAPTATGSPWPIAPPLRHSQSCGGAPAVNPAANRPDVLPSSDTIAPSGSSAPSAAHTASAVSGPVRSSGRTSAWRAAGSRGAPSASASAARAAGASSAGPARVWTSQPSGVRRLAWLGYAKNDTGAWASTSTRWRAPSSWLAANSAR